MSSQIQRFRIERMRRPRLHQLCHNRLPRTAFVLAAALLPSCVSSNPGGVEDGLDGSWSVAFENDGVSGEDNNYSNGIGIGWTSADAERYSDDSITGTFVRWASFLPQVDDPAYTKFASFALSQHIFTPEDITVADPPADDRPYSGGLFFDSSVYLLGDGAMHAWTLRLGVVGPSSLAEGLDECGRLFGSDRPVFRPNGLLPGWR